MRSIKHEGIEYTVKDETVHDEKQTVIITAISYDKAVVDLLQVRFYGLRNHGQESIRYESMLIPRRALDGIV